MGIEYRGASNIQRLSSAEKSCLWKQVQLSFFTAIFIMILEIESPDSQAKQINALLMSVPAL